MTNSVNLVPQAFYAFFQANLQHRLYRIGARVTSVGVERHPEHLGIRFAARVNHENFEIGIPEAACMEALDVSLYAAEKLSQGIQTIYHHRSLRSSFDETGD